jgi:hypothetical protein
LPTRYTIDLDIKKYRSDHNATWPCTRRRRAVWGRRALPRVHQVFDPARDPGFRRRRTCGLRRWRETPPPRLGPPARRGTFLSVWKRVECDRVRRDARQALQYCEGLPELCARLAAVEEAVLVGVVLHSGWGVEKRGLVMLRAAVRKTLEHPDQITKRGRSKLPLCPACSTASLYDQAHRPAEVWRDPARPSAASFVWSCRSSGVVVRLELGLAIVVWIPS